MDTRCTLRLRQEMLAGCDCRPTGQASSKRAALWLRTTTRTLRSEPGVATAAKRWCSVSHYFSRCRRLEPIQRTFLRTERVGSAGSFVRSRPDSNRRPPCGLTAWSPDRNQNARPIARPPPRGLPTWSDAQIPRAIIRSSSDGDKPRRDEERFAYARWLRLSSDGDEPRRNARRYQEKQAGKTRTGIAFRLATKCFHCMGAPCEGNSASLTSVQSYDQSRILFVSYPAFQDPIPCMSLVSLSSIFICRARRADSPCTGPDKPVV